jgi:hypothetical protein
MALLCPSAYGKDDGFSVDAGVRIRSASPPL